jgi:hypothetical protein
VLAEDLCPEHSHLVEQAGQVRCVCDAGYVVDAAGTACVPASTGCPPGQVLVGGECACPAGTLELEDGTCADTTGCPPHSYRVDDETCRCEPGYYVNVEQTACVPAAELCPEHSHVEEEEGEVFCACDTGYVVNADRNACVLPEEACPEGRARVVVNGELLVCCPEGASAAINGNQASCVCPDGGTWEPEGNTCTPGSACPLHSHETDPGTCVCDEGFVPAADQSCVPEGGDDLVLVTEGTTTDGYNIPMPYDYFIGRREVTMAEYGACVSAGACTDHRSDGTCLAQRLSPDAFTYGTLGSAFTAADQPAVCVTWYDAIAFLNWRSVEEGLAPAYAETCLTDAGACELLDAAGNPTTDPAEVEGYRLPMLRWEWWYAVRGGAASEVDTYAGSNVVGDVAWYRDNAGGRTHVGGAKAANELGIYDLAGNALEWQFEASTVSASMRRTMGGGWDSDAEGCEITAGGKHLPPDWSEADIGFRVVRTR